ncbi:MAG: hypothetical protein J6D12_05715 [Peptostreptococcaceae bacterium]|nr:hypothetical protein [Peptostreptococcaceae bacterium]
MNNIITTKDINKEISIQPSTAYAYIELHTTIKGITIYNGSIWGIQQITLTEDGMIKAQVNNDPTAIILHGIRDIQITNTTDSVTQYTLNIEYNI